MSTAEKRYNKTATRRIISALRHIAFAHDFLNYGKLKADFSKEIEQLDLMYEKIDNISVGDASV